jgi:hypothetical protein
MNPVRSATSVIALAGLLNACALPYDLRPQIPGAQPPQVTEPPRQADTSPPTEQRVDHVREAARLLSLAESTPGSPGQTYRLQAVGELILAGRLREAKHHLAMLDAGHSPSFRIRRGLYEAQITLYDGQPRAAMSRLQGLEPLPAVEPDIAATWHWTRAQVLLALGRNLDAARELVERERFLTSNLELAHNRQELWDILESTGTPALRSGRSLTHDPILGGWIDLALISFAYAYRPNLLSEQASAWLQRNPGHPAESIAATLGVLTTASALDTSRVALLLPLTSRFADAANAVYRGFMAVHEANSDPRRPAVVLYDIGDDPAAAPARYLQAVQAGASFVVGPLGLEAAHQVARSGVLSVPTLLLAYVDGNPGPANSVYQFGLSPEDEARQVAERAYLDGHRVAALLYPATPWGERVRGAFTDRWESLGGVVAEGQPYEPAESDHSGAIKGLLNIDDSMRRHAQLENAIKTNLAFEPRRRQDASFVFMAADAQQGRLLHPQISFHRALDLPVYATSSIFSGKPDPIYDADLNGIIFGDMPWMISKDERITVLRATLQDGWPGQHTQLDRLFALGMDAYRIMPQLNHLLNDPLTRVNGASGGITVDRGGRVHRQLIWAKFENGVPRLVEWTHPMQGKQEEVYGMEALPLPGDRAAGRGDGTRSSAAPRLLPAGP